jgi:hypothetical protein
VISSVCFDARQIYDNICRAGDDPGRAPESNPQEGWAEMLVKLESFNPEEVLRPD